MNVLSEGLDLRWLDVYNETGTFGSHRRKKMSSGSVSIFILVGRFNCLNQLCTCRWTHFRFRNCKPHWNWITNNHGHNLLFIIANSQKNWAFWAVLLCPLFVHFLFDSSDIPCARILEELPIIWNNLDDGKNLSFRSHVFGKRKNNYWRRNCSSIECY